MITVKRGKETTEITLNGELGQLMFESIAAVDSLRTQIVANVENPEEVIYEWVDGLINAAYGKQ